MFHSRAEHGHKKPGESSGNMGIDSRSRCKRVLDFSIALASWPVCVASALIAMRNMNGTTALMGGFIRSIKTELDAVQLNRLIRELADPKIPQHLAQIAREAAMAALAGITDPFYEPSDGTAEQGETEQGLGWIFCPFFREPEE